MEISSTQGASWLDDLCAEMEKYEQQTISETYAIVSATSAFADLPETDYATSNYDMLSIETIDKVRQAYQHVLKKRPDTWPIINRLEWASAEILNRLSNWSEPSRMPTFLNLRWWKNFLLDSVVVRTCSFAKLGEIIKRISMPEVSLFETAKALMENGHLAVSTSIEILQHKEFNKPQFLELATIASRDDHAILLSPTIFQRKDLLSVHEWVDLAQTCTSTNQMTFYAMQMLHDQAANLTPSDYLKMLKELLVKDSRLAYMVSSYGTNPVTSMGQPHLVAELLADHDIFFALSHAALNRDHYAHEKRIELVKTCFTKDPRTTDAWMVRLELLSPWDPNRWPLDKAGNLLCSLWRVKKALVPHTDQNKKYSDEHRHLKPDEELYLSPDQTKDHLFEHGYRRILFFYYLLIAVGNKQGFFDSHPTCYEYGKGVAKRQLQASHSSIVPNIKYCVDPLCKRGNEGPHLWVNWDILNTYLMHSLNTTVLIPSGVNLGLDKTIECQMRRKALLILNRVADANDQAYTPEHGVQEFLREIGRVFLHMDPTKGRQEEWDGTRSMMVGDRIGDNFFRYTALLELSAGPLKNKLRVQSWGNLTDKEKESAYIQIQNQIWQTHMD